MTVKQLKTDWRITNGKGAVIHDLSSFVLVFYEGGVLQLWRDDYDSGHQRYRTPVRLDIVAVAEMTPGSLGINSASFVGFRTAGWLGAFCANLGTMMPSLTLCMLAAHFITKFKGNRYLEWLFTGIRPVCIGMLAAVVVSQSRGTFLTGEGPLGIGWNLVAIAAVVGFLMNKLKLSIPKTILLGALLGLLFG